MVSAGMRIGIIGCGLIGTKRARAAKGHQICLVADVQRHCAERLASEFDARVAKNWEDVITADLDAIIVSTTHDALAEITLASLEQGKHVLVEKPAGRTAAEVIPVLEAAAQRRRIVKVGFNHRFHPAMLKARAIVDSGVMGPLMYIRGWYGHGGRLGYDKEWRCKPEISGGGELVDQGSHLIDLSRWFLGDLKLAYSAVPTYYWDITADDNCFLALEANQGQLAWLHASWTEWKNSFCLQIYGKYGKLTIDGLGGSYGVERLTFHKMLPEMGPPETTIWEFPFPDRSWDLEFKEFVRAIETGDQPIGNISDALATMIIIDMAYGRGES